MKIRIEVEGLFVELEMNLPTMTADQTLDMAQAAVLQKLADHEPHTDMEPEEADDDDSQLNGYATDADRY